MRNKNRRIPSRYFNNVALDLETKLITKSSTDEAKLINEIQWYLNLPKTLKSYTPPLIDYSTRKGNVFLQLDYLPFPTLAELYIKQALSYKEWKSIFSQIERLLTLFLSYTTSYLKEDVISMYVDKTRQRLNTFVRHNTIAKMNFYRGYFNLNGSKVICPLNLFEKKAAAITERINTLNDNCFTIIHGDLCFSNIIYDQDNQSLFLIDPRGSFGRTGLYGDQRYDISKIRHSFSGYDFIVYDLASVSYSEESIFFEIPLTSYHQNLSKEWDNRFKEIEVEIRLIEALLFLSMLPLHQDHNKRQLIMYGLGTKLLHEAVSYL